MSTYFDYGGILTQAEAREIAASGYLESMRGTDDATWNAWVKSVLDMVEARRAAVPPKLPDGPPEDRQP